MMTIMFNSNKRFLRLVSVFAALVNLISSASAFTTTRPDGVSLAVSIAPSISAVGSVRSIFVHGASGPVTFDESAIPTTGTLMVRMTPEVIGVLASPLVISYTPRNVGSLKVILRLADGTSAETQMETVAATRSTVNLDGMWFDPATNGSGIAFNHASGSDSIFGTWFLYGPAAEQRPNDSTRWYSLQSMKWIQSATALVGIAYEARANVNQAFCPSGDDCPRSASLRPTGSVGISIIDVNNLRVVAFDHYGRSVFVSLLKRLTP